MNNFKPLNLVIMVLLGLFSLSLLAENELLHNSEATELVNELSDLTGNLNLLPSAFDMQSNHIEFSWPDAAKSVFTASISPRWEWWMYNNRDCQPTQQYNDGVASSDQMCIENCNKKRIKSYQHVYVEYIEDAGGFRPNVLVEHGCTNCNGSNEMSFHWDSLQHPSLVSYELVNTVLPIVEAQDLGSREIIRKISISKSYSFPLHGSYSGNNGIYQTVVTGGTDVQRTRLNCSGSISLLDTNTSRLKKTLTSRNLVEVHQWKRTDTDQLIH